MKYKVGDKFLIEIDEVYESEMPFSSPNELFKAKGFNSLVFDKNGNLKRPLSRYRKFLPKCPPDAYRFYMPDFPLLQF